VLCCARCYCFQGRYTESQYAVSVDLVLDSDRALLCSLTHTIRTNNGGCRLICFISDFNFALYHTRCYSLSQASAGSELLWQQGPKQKSDEPDLACLMFQTLPLVCMCCSSHMSLYVIIFASLILGILSVTINVFITQNTQKIPLLYFIAVGWSWQMLDCLLILFSAAMSQTALCLFPLSKGSFVGATSLVL